MSVTVTIPTQALKAIALTGTIVTINGKIQGKIRAIEGDTWTVMVNPDDTLTVDLDATHLFHLEDASVRYSRHDQHTGHTVHEWTTLSRVTRGVCLVK